MTETASSPAPDSLLWLLASVVVPFPIWTVCICALEWITDLETHGPNLFFPALGLSISVGLFCLWRFPMTRVARVLSVLVYMSLYVFLLSMYGYVFVLTFYHD